MSDGLPTYWSNLCACKDGRSSSRGVRPISGNASVRAETGLRSREPIILVRVSRVGIHASPRDGCSADAIWFGHMVGSIW